MQKQSYQILGLILVSICVAFWGCSGPQMANEQSNQAQPAAANQSIAKSNANKEADKLVLGAYTVPKEAYEKEIIPAFQRYWLKKTGREVVIERSYVASGAQARAIIGGFEADVATLSLEGDIEKLVEEKLITHDWKKRPWRGFITNSVAVIGVRPGNPKNIKGWEDLTRSDVEVIYPNPKTSGGAQWVVNAIYGGGLKMTERDKGAPDPEYARDLLKRVQARVKVMDKSARQAMTTFERGIGDATITYENETLLRAMEGRESPFIIPDATVLIENPVAIVDRNVEKHGTKDIAEDFVLFLHTDECQKMFATYGLRPVNPVIAEQYREKYPLPPLLFTVEYLGGWSKINQGIFGNEGIWTKIVRELAQDEQ